MIRQFVAGHAIVASTTINVNVDRNSFRSEESPSVGESKNFLPFEIGTRLEEGTFSLFESMKSEIFEPEYTINTFLFSF